MSAHHAPSTCARALLSGMATLALVVDTSLVNKGRLTALN
jgi:hypothetical protein